MSPQSRVESPGIASQAKPARTRRRSRRIPENSFVIMLPQGGSTENACANIFRRARWFLLQILGLHPGQWYRYALRRRNRLS